MNTNLSKIQLHRKRAVEFTDSLMSTVKTTEIVAVELSMTGMVLATTVLTSEEAACQYYDKFVAMLARHQLAHTLTHVDKHNIDIVIDY
jgi:hypothetical protein